MFFKTILFQGSAAIDDWRRENKDFAKSNVRGFNQKLDKHEIFFCQFEGMRPGYEMVCCDNIFTGELGKQTLDKEVKFSKTDKLRDQTSLHSTQYYLIKFSPSPALNNFTL